jgi:hypothetical protein
MKERLNPLVRRAATVTLLALALAGCNMPLHRPDCPPGQTLGAERLHGTWRLELTGATAPWALSLGPHPEHLGSLRGELRQGTQRYPVVADLEGRDFTMEESHDGQRIAATWLGTAVPGHCGGLIQGERIDKDQARQGFSMQRNP